ncbi:MULTISPECIES: response regulator [Sulfurospirillum]|jgi:DNA-binding response OmpR family regulator|uniref:response regulator n=1 Tax=Sulfurospirillum TaxID=57665 RepID=UPI000542DFE1|nr:MULTISPECIES: response regulator [Sulfurospirillum]KHG34098.1 MAG: regulator [Sulfurospirillum sp. MES]MCP3652841.1 response regulator [Sulfurospirillum sp. DNRA8]MCR1811693.1 response regulator [Sulfurospirillum sp. DNRA8]MDY0263681.1 response regulator [Sulfurospirillum cavolei]
MNKRNFELLGTFNVLYIEDEADLLKHTTSVLEDFVKKIYPVQTIDEALEIIKTEKIDVIIADIHLRYSNGLDFLRTLKHDLEIEMPSIVTTAFSDTEYLLDAIKLHVDNYLIKPVNIKELLNALHDVLLPKIQAKEIERSYNIIKTISAVTDSKQVEIIRFIIKNLDNDNMLNYSYSEIMEQVGVSKPTVIKLFKQLGDQGILTKIQNKKYLFDETKLPLPEEA